MNISSLTASFSPTAVMREYGRSPSLAISFLARVFGLQPLLQRYYRLSFTRSPAEFARRALKALDIKVQAQGESLDSLPASGPLLLVANHPFGCAEGLALAATCSHIRPDLKILVNKILYNIPELRQIFIPVDVFAGKDGMGNIAGLREALRHMKAGGALAIFPSGVVSHWRIRERCVTDPVWNQLVGRLAKIADTSVVPLYFEGYNSMFFQAAGCLHPMLRTMLLPRELWRMRDSTLNLRVGKAVEPDILSAFHDDKARTSYIRARCYALGRLENSLDREWPVPVANPTTREILLDEIKSLPPSRVLVEDETFKIVCLNGNEAPHILREIGRLREKTFRAANEGSGKSLDIDRFDPHYTHLVLWDMRAGVVAGGYRAQLIFPSDVQRASKILYTASLFHFSQGFFEHCGVSMELGRAFITSEYQRDYTPLLMLWKGIGRLAAMAGTRILFGPSSIGLGYAPESVCMLRQHLEECCFSPTLAAMVQGRRPPRSFLGPNMPDARKLEYKILDRAVKGLEGDKGIPILFKHYLQLGGRIVAFHEDRDFGTLDALTVVNLEAAPEKLLLRYMGEKHLRILRTAHTPTYRSSNEFFTKVF